MIFPSPVTMFILVALVAMGFVGMKLAPGINDRLMFRPYLFASGQHRFTLVSAAFIHADLAHLLFNAVTLWSFGPLLEAQIGSGRYAMLYACALLVAQVWTYFKHRGDSNYATLGASGAISGVVFASIVYYPTQRLFILPIPWPLPAPLFALGYLAYTLWSSRVERGRINHDAHLGGALAGLGFVALTDPLAFLRAARALGY